MAEWASVKDVVLIAAVGLHILRLLVRWRQASKSPLNGRSGDKPISYWAMETRKAIRDELTDHDQRVRAPDLEEARIERQVLMTELRHLRRETAQAIVEIKRQLRIGGQENGR